MTSGEQIEGLLEGELDLGLIRDPDKIPGLHLELLSSENLVAVLPDSHPLSDAREIGPKMLEGEPLVLFPYRLMPGFVSRIMALLEPMGAPPYVVQQAIHQETVLGLVAAGLGISILPESVTRFQMPGVKLRPFETHPQTELHIARGKGGSAAADEFISCLKRASRASD
jgi:DNA-binding transcriptional LysR family regulator